MFQCNNFEYTAELRSTRLRYVDELISLEQYLISAARRIVTAALTIILPLTKNSRSMYTSLFLGLINSGLNLLASDMNLI